MNTLAQKAGRATVPGLLGSRTPRSFAVRTAAWVDANSPAPAVAAAMHRAAWQGAHESRTKPFNAEVTS